MDTSKVTALQVAQWMLEELMRVKYLHQSTVVYDVEAKFGSDFVYINSNGNQAISRNVLSEFKELTKDIAVWERGERMWRMREDYDPVGKRQAD
jgi:hypothetical protein